MAEILHPAGNSNGHHWAASSLADTELMVIWRALVLGTSTSPSHRLERNENGEWEGGRSCVTGLYGAPDSATLSPCHVSPSSLALFLPCYISVTSSFSPFVVDSVVINGIICFESISIFEGTVVSFDFDRYPAWIGVEHLHPLHRPIPAKARAPDFSSPDRSSKRYELLVLSTRSASSTESFASPFYR